MYIFDRWSSDKGNIFPAFDVLFGEPLFPIAPSCPFTSILRSSRIYGSGFRVREPAISGFLFDGKLNLYVSYYCKIFPSSSYFIGPEPYILSIEAWLLSSGNLNTFFTVSNGVRSLHTEIAQLWTCCLNWEMSMYCLLALVLFRM